MLGCIHLLCTHPPVHLIDPSTPRSGRLPDLSGPPPPPRAALLCGCNTTTTLFPYFWNIVSRAPESVNRFRSPLMRRTNSGHPLLPTRSLIPSHVPSVVRPVCLSVIWTSGLPSVLVPSPSPRNHGCPVFRHAPPDTKHRPLGTICLGAARHHPLDLVVSSTN